MSTTVSDKADFDSILNEPDEDEAPAAASEPTSEPGDVPVAATEPALTEPVTASEPVPSAVTLPEGYTTDATGRVHRPDGTMASKDELAAMAKAEPKPVAEPAPAAKPVAETPPPVAAAPPVVPVPAAQPFLFRADGQRIPVEGAMLAPDGTLTIPAAQVAQIRTLLAAGVRHNGTYVQERKQWEEKASTASAAEKARAEKYNAVSLKLFDVVERLLVDKPEEFASLRRELALDLREADLNAPKTTPVASPDEAVLERNARTTLQDAVDEYFDNPTAAALFSPDDRKELNAAVQQMLNAYFVDQDGEILLDLHALRAHLDREVKLQQRARQVSADAEATARKAREAAAFNAANVARPAPTLKRPTPALVAAPSGAPTKSWDQRVNDIFKDTDDED